MAAPAGFWAALSRKYDIMQQQADTARMGMVAQANLDTVKAGLLPAESRSQIAVNDANISLAGANTKLTGAKTQQTDEETKTIKPLADASIFSTRAQGRLYGAQATGEEQLNKVSTSLFGPRGLGNNLGRLDEFVRSSLRLGLGPFAGAE